MLVRIAVVVEEGIKGLGFSVTAAPPQPVVVRAVTPGGWAESNGIEVGMELVALNGDPLSGMSEAEFRATIPSTRPLMCVFVAGQLSSHHGKQVSLWSPFDNGHAQMSIEAREGPLGFKVWPALQRALVQSVEAGGWAEKSHIMPGDELVSIGGKDVSQATLAAALSPTGRRPLRLSFARHGEPCAEWEPAESSRSGSASGSRHSSRSRSGSRSGGSQGESEESSSAGEDDGGDEERFSAAATGIDSVLGFEHQRELGGATRIVAVSPNGWAARAGVAPGNLLVTVNFKPAESLSEEVLSQQLAKTRPLQLTFARVLGYEVLAEASVQKLGFSPSSLPPGPVFVASVVSGGWAEQAGILRGDKLLTANGAVVADMEEEAFVVTLRDTRPLCMRLRRRHHRHRHRAKG